MEGDIINQLEEEGRAVVGGEEEEEEGGKEALVTSRAVCCPPELAAITRRPSIFLPDIFGGSVQPAWKNNYT